MIRDEEIDAQATRILRELPEHPAPRRFCFADWEAADYHRLVDRLCQAGVSALHYVLPDVSLLVGPPAPRCELRIR